MCIYNVYILMRKCDLVRLIFKYTDRNTLLGPSILTNTRQFIFRAFSSRRKLLQGPGLGVKSRGATIAHESLRGLPRSSW